MEIYLERIRDLLQRESDNDLHYFSTEFPSNQHKTITFKYMRKRQKVYT